MISARRKRGIVMPRKAKNDRTVSIHEYCRVAARMPKPMPSTEASRWQVSAIAIVLGRRSPTTSETGWL